MKKLIVTSLILLITLPLFAPNIAFRTKKVIYKANTIKVQIKPFKLDRDGYFSKAITDIQLDSIITYCNIHCNFDPNIVITTMYRESGFNPKIKNKHSSAIGLGQFTKAAIKYHKLDRDSITNYMYATRAIVSRYNDIIKRFSSNISKRELIAAYGSYNRIKKHSYNVKAIDKLNKLHSRKEKELQKFKIQ